MVGDVEDVTGLIPPIVWSQPWPNAESVNPFVPETVRAVVDAYGSIEALVEVAVIRST